MRATIFVIVLEGIANPIPDNLSVPDTIIVFFSASQWNLPYHVLT
jgi:hypothetical protein